MSNFEKIMATPEALGAFLASLSVATGPWDESFHEKFCASCEREDCDTENCPHKDERNNPLWWLVQTAEGGQDTRRTAWAWRNGRLELEPGIIVRLENPLRVHIRAAKRETPLGAVMADEALQAVWQTVEKVKKVHPDAEISVEVEV